MTSALGVDGGVFQACAVFTWNARLMSIYRWVDRTARVSVVADRRWWCVDMSDVSCRVLATYGCAVPCWQQCVRTQRQNLIISGTLNQWLSQRSGVTCS